MSNDLIGSVAVGLMGFIVSGLVGIVIYFLNQKMGSVDLKIDSIDTKLSLISRDIERDLNRIKIELITKISEIDLRLGEKIIKEVNNFANSKFQFDDVLSSVERAMEGLKNTIKIVKENAEKLDKLDTRILSKIEITENQIKAIASRVIVIETEVKSLGKVIVKK